MNSRLNKLSMGMVFFLSLFLLQCDDSNSNTNGDGMTLALIGKRLISVPEPSGITYDYMNDVLKVVSDQTGFIYLLSTNGDLLTVLEYEGNDPEAIALDPSSNTMYISMEEQGEIVKLDSSGHFLDFFSVPDYGGGSNKGVEGLTFIEETGHLLYIYEKSPAILVESDTLGGIINTTPMNFANDFSGMEYRDEKNTIFICSDEDETLFEYQLGVGVIDSWNLEIEQMEGITTKEDTLFIISDSEEELYIYLMSD